MNKEDLYKLALDSADTVDAALLAARNKWPEAKTDEMPHLAGMILQEMRHRTQRTAPQTAPSDQTAPQAPSSQTAQGAVPERIAQVVIALWLNQVLKSGNLPQNSPATEMYANFMSFCNSSNGVPENLVPNISQWGNNLQALGFTWVQSGNEVHFTCPVDLAGLVGQVQRIIDAANDATKSQ